MIMIMTKSHTSKIYSVLCLWMLLFAGTGTGLTQQLEIRVDAGLIDRNHSIVSVHLPGHVEEGSYIIQDLDGREHSFQVDSDNRGWLVLNHLPAGDHHIFTFDSAKQVNSNLVSFVKNDQSITLRSGHREILSYFHDYNDPPASLDDRYRRGGYIHPVYTPGGSIVTNHLNEVQHPHHSGIWSAWTSTRYQDRSPDFWNIHNNTGRVDHYGGLIQAWEGSVTAGFKAMNQFIDLSAEEPVSVLLEEWVVRSYISTDEYHIFDLVVTQSVRPSDPLILPEYRYGGVGFRGHADWDDPENCIFLTSEGLGRDGHATRVNWTHIGGLSDGKLAGITIMGHPSNFRHPQPVRIHPDEPFFNYAPQQLGEFTIEPGSPYKARYRYIVYDGEPDPAKLDRIWADFAYPAGVTILKNNQTDN